MTEGQCQFRPKPKKTERQLSAFGRNRNYAERGHLPTFGAETETEAEFRSASSVNGIMAAPLVDSRIESEITYRQGVGLPYSTLCLVLFFIIDLMHSTYQY